MSDQRDVAERDNAKLSRELEKIKAWGDQIAELMSALEDLTEYFDKYAASRPPGMGVSLPEQSLRELSDHFHDVCQDMSFTLWELSWTCCAWHNLLVSSWLHLLGHSLESETHVCMLELNKTRSVRTTCKLRSSQACSCDLAGP